MPGSGPASEAPGFAGGVAVFERSDSIEVRFGVVTGTRRDFLQSALAPAEFDAFAAAYRETLIKLCGAR